MSARSLRFRNTMTKSKKPPQITRHRIACQFSSRLVFFAIALLLAIGASTGTAVEVTLLLNTPDKDEITGTLKEVKEDGTITVIGPYGEQTFRQSEYVTAVCPEPAEYTQARQAYSRGDYEKALALYKQAYADYGMLGWGAASLEGIGNCHRFMGNPDAAIENYTRLLADYPNYAGSRRVKYALAQVREGRADLAGAVELYGQVAQEADDVLSAASLRNIGNVLSSSQKHEEALLYYLRVAILYQNLPQAPVAECMFRAADCFETLAADRPPQEAAKFQERAKKYYLDVMTRYPQSEFADPARLRYQSLNPQSESRDSQSDTLNPQSVIL